MPVELAEAALKWQALRIAWSPDAVHNCNLGNPVGDVVTVMASHNIDSKVCSSCAAGARRDPAEVDENIRDNISMDTEVFRKMRDGLPMESALLVGEKSCRGKNIGAGVKSGNF